MAGGSHSNVAVTVGVWEQIGCCGAKKKPQNYSRTWYLTSADSDTGGAPPASVYEASGALFLSFT